MTTTSWPAMLPELTPDTAPGSSRRRRSTRRSPVNWLSAQTRRGCARDGSRRWRRTAASTWRSSPTTPSWAWPSSSRSRGCRATSSSSELRAAIFRGLADHEIGHTMGLRHNFAGLDRRAQLRRQLLERSAAMAAQDKWDANRISEYAYSSVMDYGVALQQRHPRPRQVRHGGHPLRLRRPGRRDAEPRADRRRPAREPTSSSPTTPSCRRSWAASTELRRRRRGALQRSIASTLERHYRGGGLTEGGSSSPPSGPTSSARTSSSATSTARPGTSAPTSARSSTTRSTGSRTTTSSTPSSAGASTGRSTAT